MRNLNKGWMIALVVLAVFGASSLLQKGSYVFAEWNSRGNVQTEQTARMHNRGRGHGYKQKDFADHCYNYR